MRPLLFQAKGPPLPGWVSLDQGRVFVSPRFLEEARRRGWDSLQGVCGPPRGETVRSTPFRVPTREGGVFRKVHHKGWKGAGFRDRLRLRAHPFLSPARTEIYWSDRLAGLGILTPVPLLLAEEGPKDGRSALVTRAVEGGLPLDRIQESPSPGLTAAAALLVAELHREGLVHRDLYLNHLLRDAQGEIWLADLQRMMKPRAFFERWRVKDLAALLHSAPPRARGIPALRFFLSYARRLGLERKALRPLLRKITKKEKKMRSHKPRWD